MRKPDPARYGWTLAAALVAACGLAPAQTVQRGPTRSPHGPVAAPCASCHTSISWTPARSMPEFDHNTETRFPLRGMHERVECRLCHVNLRFAAAKSDCAACHADIHRGQLGARCESCHSVKGWNASVAALKQHSNRFPLVGAHAMAACESCHRGAATARFVGLSTDCASCHMREYERARTLDHRAAGLPTQCAQCHSADSWRSTGNFDHARVAGFALDGAHARLECSSCHAGGRFGQTRSDCFSCHAQEYRATRNPNHAATGFSTSCSTCHTTARWQGASFDHNSQTRFPLTGAHVQISCNQCHTGTSGASAQCASCHLDEFRATTNPNHTTAGFPQDCAACHTTTGWAGAKFDHSRTRFALTGAHATLQCASCHTNGRYAGLATDCASCHLGTFQRTTNPNHVTAGFPQDCAVCHSTSGWAGARFDHSRTQFALTGAHAPLQCSSCHVNGRYAGLSTDCAACHLPAFQRTTNPNHTSAGFPQQCAVCHSTTAWQPAAFNHSTTQFPLTGAHTQVACANCHIGGRYAGTPTDCYACHKVAYDQVTNPNHRAAGFPTACANCHTTSTWSGARFNHLFPIYSGKHAGKWTTCNDCHTNTSNYAAFSCTNCHEHNKTRMDEKHREVRNYVYNSANCYACHPKGDE